jgi:pentatricopeptide repeat protein
MRHPGCTNRVDRRIGRVSNARLIWAWFFAAQALCAASTVSATPPASGTAARFKLASVAAPSSDLEARLFADAADGRLDEFSPLDAALVASGSSDCESLERYRCKTAGLVDELRRSGKCVGAPRARAESVLDFMHRRVLRGGYRIENTDLRATLDEGRFNCVTASILFNHLAGQFGLECRGLAGPGHAMSRVLSPSGTLDLETTCPRWFQLVANPQAPPQPTARILGVTAAADRAAVREVSPIQMAAMIYYNKGVDLLAEKRFAESVAANAKAVRLDPRNVTARGNLLATLNNWSIELSDQEQFIEAIDVLHEGLSLEPTYKAFAQNFVHVHHQWVENLCRAGRFDEALEVLSRAAAEMPDQPYLRRARGEVSERLAKAIAERKDGR